MENTLIDEVFQAAQTGDAAKLNEMLAAHPQLANTENGQGLTPLGYAAHFGKAAAVHTLLDRGAAVNAVSHSKVPFIPSNTALHAAIAGERSLEVIKLLLAHQAQTTIADSNGHTALHVAAFHEDSADIIRLLLAHGADVHACRAGGDTALSLAVKQGNTKVAELLRFHGAVD
ncbi:ankyrin repeat domain-containing protein [Paenibacillus montanisoli]|uniref:Ankyrin repeat domain-containing protein n=1 Tax=Paenibacillus montanisoli TaxID=2081970 RepID=A0A328TVQ4_9BACL|nr:ankyrin repeat domain-containing protein [Paenibacillus montanisoli]RAP73583.1 ankyrin repeat domain-containing protein [Paenibacillus montanisoli]